MPGKTSSSPRSGRPEEQQQLFSRLQAANGNSRYQYWQSALHAAETHPWRGIGPGTFQFWWAQHATSPGFIRNAHSLYFETLAETGIVGLACSRVLLWLAGVAVRRALREPPEVRVWLAGATASLAVFAFAAALEWVWQLAAIAAAALILGAVIVAGRGDYDRIGSTPNPRHGAGRTTLPRAGLVALALFALGAVLVPLAGERAIRASQAAVTRGDLSAALTDSREAQRVQPYSSTAHLQEALVLEAAGEPGRRRSPPESPRRFPDRLDDVADARADRRPPRRDPGRTRRTRRVRQLNPYFSLFSHP